MVGAVEEVLESSPVRGYVGRYFGEMEFLNQFHQRVECVLFELCEVLHLSELKLVDSLSRSEVLETLLPREILVLACGELFENLEAALEFRESEVSFEIAVLAEDVGLEGRECVLRPLRRFIVESIEDCFKGCPLRSFTFTQHPSLEFAEKDLDYSSKESHCEYELESVLRSAKLREVESKLMF